MRTLSLTCRSLTAIEILEQMPATSGASCNPERPETWSLPEQISEPLPVFEPLPVSEPLPVFESLPVSELSVVLQLSACLQLMRCSSVLKPVLNKAEFYVPGCSPGCLPCSGL